MESVDIGKIKFDEKGLVPAVVQDARSGEVLMVAYMNAESLAKTVESGETWFFSRSRQKLWHKGEESGHFQHVKRIYVDCDADTLVVEAIPEGPAIQETAAASIGALRSGIIQKRKEASPSFIRSLKKSKTAEFIPRKNLIPITSRRKVRIKSTKK